MNAEWAVLCHSCRGTWTDLSGLQAEPPTNQTSNLPTFTSYLPVLMDHRSPPPTLPDPPAFSPTASAIWVKSLWFLSLVISLASALFAILLQQWARSYLTMAHARNILPREARIREFLTEGVIKFRLPFVAGALLTLHHTFFFFLWDLLCSFPTLILLLLPISLGHRSWRTGISRFCPYFGAIAHILRHFCHRSGLYNPLQLPDS